MMKLMIVESPNKTKKIASYLGKGWFVEASFGHIRDLPLHAIGVSAPDYLPTYEVPERSKKQAAKLKDLAKKVNEIWLATDPDREGEAIAWHLNQLLGKGKTVRRVTFTEITESAILKAVSQPREIDEDLVNAQQARRVLDRLYGYKLSPALSDRLSQQGVSAGRVQTIALRLIVDRELEIRNFKKTSHFGVQVDYEGWSAKWDTKPLVTDDCPYILDRSIAEQVLSIAEQELIVSDFKKTQQQRKPPAPLITSTLQQAAANRLNMSVSATMAAAQKLFEEGLITYMRTDNPNLSAEGIAAAQAFLRSVGQDAHIADPPHKWASKEGAQEAHEAIRPTDFTVRKANTGDMDADDLYQLIWRVAIAACMKSAEYHVITIKLNTTESFTFADAPNPPSKPEPALFTATGRELIYAGWQVLAKDYTDEEEDEEKMLLANADIAEGKTIMPKSGEVLELETRAPRRFTETSLVKLLEREGIGRPATYANIIDTQLKRHYAEIKKKQFYPTELGEAVIKALVGHFDILETAYTAEMEEKLDEIATGKANYVGVVTEYDKALDNQLHDFYQANGKEHILCPDCQSGYLRCINGKNGKFWGCSNYKNGCKYIAQDDNGKPMEISKEYQCPECKKGFLQKHPSKKNKNKFWWGCSEYRNGCKYMTFDDDGKPKNNV